MNALVLGGTSDIARACVERLRDDGMTVVLIGPEQSGEDVRRLTGGRVDVLVTCASVRLEGSIEATSEAAFSELLEANLSAAFRASRACFQAMCGQGKGSMVHIASDAGLRAEHEAGAYSVVCAGVIALSELLAAEGAPHGIRSNAVCPRAGTDVAPIVAWLVSEESRHMSGAVLRVDDAAGVAMTVDTRTA